MKFRRQYREPRPGEVATFLSTHATWVKAYERSDGKELRFRPCPSCNDSSPHNPSSQVHSESGLWRCFKCQAVGNFFTLTRAFGSPLLECDRYKDCESYIPPEFFEKFKASPARRPVSGNHYPGLLDYCYSRQLGKDTLDAFKVSSKGPKAFRWPIYAWNGTWAPVNSRIRSIDKSASCRDWFEIKGGPTGLLLGNHLTNLNGPRRWGPRERLGRRPQKMR